MTENVSTGNTKKYKERLCGIHRAAETLWDFLVININYITIENIE